jgi:hypothetical protein
LSSEVVPAGNITIPIAFEPEMTQELEIDAIPEPGMIFFFNVTPINLDTVGLLQKLIQCFSFFFSACSQYSSGS